MNRHARIPGASPPLRGRGFPRFRGFLVVALLLAASAAASAQEGKVEAPVDLRRLKFEYKCFFGTAAWKGKGEDEFLRRLSAQRAAYAARAKEQLPAFEDLMAEALWSRAESHRAANDLKAASERAGEILLLESNAGRVAELRPQADELVISWSLSEAKRFEEAEKNDVKAWDAYANCLGTRNEEALKTVMAGMTRIALRRNDYEGARAANSLAAEGAALQKVMAELAAKVPPAVLSRGWPDIQRLRDRLTQIEESTGYVDITFLPPAGDLQKYRGPAAALDIASARLRFVPVSEGQPWPNGEAPEASTTPALLLIRGVYDVQVFAPGATEPSCLWLRVPVGKARFALEIPGRAPEGMVYVGPWQGGGGFFVDRTEVTVGQVRAAAAADPALQGLLGVQEKVADPVPAWFRDDDQGEPVSTGTAEKFAASVGKRIPTFRQWSDAAFGPAPAAWPWGNEAPDPAKHLVAGVGEAQPVGSRPSGASPFGCLDMAGNLTEWVQGEGGLWAVGGHFSGELVTDGRNRLKEPAPGFAAYNGMADKNKYSKYKAPFEEYWTTGLRLVIPVK